MKAKIVRAILKNEHITYWQLAKEMKVSESTVYRMLRDENAILSEDDETRIKYAINAINNERSS